MAHTRCTPCLPRRELRRPTLRESSLWPELSPPRLRLIIVVYLPITAPLRILTRAHTVVLRDKRIMEGIHVVLRAGQKWPFMAIYGHPMAMM
jgi:hypothetical protein